MKSVNSLINCIESLLCAKYAVVLRGIYIWTKSKFCHSRCWGLVKKNDKGKDIQFPKLREQRRVDSCRCDQMGKWVSEVGFEKRIEFQLLPLGRRALHGKVIKWMMARIKLEQSLLTDSGVQLGAAGAIWLWCSLEIPHGCHYILFCFLMALPVRESEALFFRNDKQWKEMLYSSHALGWFNMGVLLTMP